MRKGKTMAKKRTGLQGSIQKATFETLEHNYRVKYTANEVFYNEKNEHLRTLGEARQRRKTFLSQAESVCRENTISKRQPNGQGFQKKAHLNYSCVLPCTKETTPQDVYNSVGKWFEKELGVAIWDIVIHKDEGKIISKTEFDKNGNSRVYGSGVKGGFWYNQNDGAYYKDKDFTQLLAKDFGELQEKFEIIKNYHFHLEFSGVRADGSSINTPCFVDRKNGKNQKYTYKLLDNNGKSGFYKRGFRKKAIQCLNDELKRQSKEPVVEETQSNEPINRIPGYKHLKNLQEKKKFEGLSEKEEKTLQTLEKQAKKVVDMTEFDKGSQMKWNKSTIKIITKNRLNHLNELLKNVKLEYKKPLFEEIASLRDSFNPKIKELETYLNELDEIQTRHLTELERLNDDKLTQIQADNEALCKELKQKDSDINELLSTEAKEMQELWKKDLQRYNYCLSQAENENLGKNERLEAYEALESEVKSFIENETLRDKFYAKVSEEQGVSAIIDFQSNLAILKAKIEALPSNHHKQS